MITFTEETFDQCYDDLLPILQEHAEAFGPYGYPLAMRHDIYRQIEAMNNLSVTVAREDGKAVGYASYIISPHLHYDPIIVASADAFYLVPEKRKGTVGIRLLDAAEKNCKERGATFIVQKCKTHTDLTHLFERLGYSMIEYTFLKELK